MIRYTELTSEPEVRGGNGHPPRPRGKVPSVERAIRVLNALNGDTSSRRLSDLSEELELSKSTLSELLSTLEGSGFVERDPDSRLFRLGPALVELGRAARRDMSLTRVARRDLDWLHQVSEETAILHVQSAGAAVIVDASESRHQLKVVAPLGHRLPPFGGAVAKVLFAALPEDEWVQAVGRGPLPAFTARSIIDPDAYRAELQRVRRRGYATDDEEYLAGTRAVSAGIVDETGRTVAVITVIGASSRMGRDRLQTLAHQTAAAAARISKGLGARLPDAGALP